MLLKCITARDYTNRHCDFHNGLPEMTDLICNVSIVAVKELLYVVKEKRRRKKEEKYVFKVCGTLFFSLHNDINIFFVLWGVNLTFDNIQSEPGLMNTIGDNVPIRNKTGEK